MNCRRSTREARTTTNNDRGWIQTRKQWGNCKHTSIRTKRKISSLFLYSTSLSALLLVVLGFWRSSNCCDLSKYQQLNFSRGFVVGNNGGLHKLIWNCLCVHSQFGNHHASPMAGVLPRFRKPDSLSLHFVESFMLSRFSWVSCGHFNKRSPLLLIWSIEETRSRHCFYLLWLQNKQ